MSFNLSQIRDGAARCRELALVAAVALLGGALGGCLRMPSLRVGAMSVGSSRDAAGSAAQNQQEKEVRVARLQGEELRSPSRSSDSDGDSGGRASPAESSSRVRVGVAAGGPALMTGDWNLGTTLSMTTDSRYDDVNTREQARRQEENELALRRSGQLATNPMAPFVRGMHLDHGPLGKLLQNEPAPPDSAAQAAGSQVAAAVQTAIREAPAPGETEPAPRQKPRCEPWLPTLGATSAEGQVLSLQHAVMVQRLSTCAQVARDRRERTRWLLLTRLAEGQPLRQAATATGLRLTCARQIQERFTRMQQPAVRSVVQPREYLFDTCHEAKRTAAAERLARAQR